MGWTSIVGTYDAIAIPLLLEKELVLSLLPDHLKNSLCATPLISEALRITVPDEYHPVLFLLGRQSNCGVYALPGKRSFQEAKLEIPFIHHPSSDVPHSLKQTLMFSSRMMSVASEQVKGLRSRYLQFEPAEYSSRDSSQIEHDIRYSILDVLEFQGKTSAVASETPPESKGLKLDEDAMRMLLGLPWFGANSGATVAKFIYDWESSTRNLERLEGTLSWDFNFFSLNRETSTTPEASKGPQQRRDVPCHAYRFCSYFTTV